MKTYQWRKMGRITIVDADAEPEAEQLFPPDKAIQHYENLLAGDGVTCADLVVFGAELRKALRAKQEAERAQHHAPTGS